MACSTTPEWIVNSYGVVILISVLMLIYVMQKTDHDRDHKRDARWIRETRRAAYIVVSFAAANSYLQDISPLSVLILVVCAIGLLVITAIALDRRHPMNGLREADPSTRAVVKWNPLRQVIAFFRRR